MSVRGSVSSQFATALTDRAAPDGRRCTLEIEGDLISKPYVEITVNTMRRFGSSYAARVVAIERPRRVIDRPARSTWRGDASAASYFSRRAGAIRRLAGGGPVTRGGRRAAPASRGDVPFTEVLERMGAGVAMGDNWIEAGPGPQCRRAS